MSQKTAATWAVVDFHPKVWPGSELLFDVQNFDFGHSIFEV